MIELLRKNNVVAGVLAIIRIYLGYMWFTAGLGKVTGGFDATGFLQGAVANPVAGPDGVVYGWYVDFLQVFAIPNADLFNILVPWGEVLVGLGLMLGCFTTAAAFFGMVMNFSFLLAGTVSHNPTDILIGTVILVAGANAGKFGLDRYVLPYLRTVIARRREQKEGKETVEV
ncbi:DoxX family protein [Aquibacillus koreensis]|uniref:DoxX family protein n=1 Tax=Aquibacillus koreensis TaxID=279446 RepID=A0A9X3WID1_9BACI|nr:DoxX family protein [Aquibacillus koreensis]MCT2534887.1 DoxX family protein [Aquibacillus koreensis]MDC3419503.1 DoxX family protein [Aquibacillus koreensis]